MVDTSPGPGWWVASDGRWYPPELHPDTIAAARRAEREHLGHAPVRARVPSTSIRHLSAGGGLGAAVLDRPVLPGAGGGRSRPSIDLRTIAPPSRPTPPRTPPRREPEAPAEPFDLTALDPTKARFIEPPVPTLPAQPAPTPVEAPSLAAAPAVLEPPVAEPAPVVEPAPAPEPVDTAARLAPVETEPAPLVLPQPAEIRPAGRVEAPPPPARPEVEAPEPPPSPRPRSTRRVVGAAAIAAGVVALGVAGYRAVQDDSPAPAPTTELEPATTVTTTPAVTSTAAPATTAATTSVPTTTAAIRPVSVFSIEVGTCVNNPDIGRGLVSTLTRVPCDQPHTHEVFQTLRYPGDNPLYDPAAVTTYATDQCRAAFGDYLGVPYEQSKYYFLHLAPSAESWTQNNDREIVCLLYHPAGLNAPAKGRKE